MAYKLIGGKGEEKVAGKEANGLRGRELLGDGSGLSRTYKADYNGIIANSLPCCVGGMTFTYIGKNADGKAVIDVEERGEKIAEIACQMGVKTVIPSCGGRIQYDADNSPTLLDGGVSITPKEAGINAVSVTIKLEPCLGDNKS